MTELKKGLIRVLCVDDSALMRRIMTEVINAEPDMEVVGTAPDPLVARDMIKQLNPDVITLDVEMPKMDGLDFLERLMRLRPMPVVMVSSLTQKHSAISLRALELGAVEIVSKPNAQSGKTLEAYQHEVADKIRAASRARLKNYVVPGQEVPVIKTAGTASNVRNDWVVAIGSSTGGTEALSRVLTGLPRECPPIVITQHMPAGFTASFVQRLDRTCALTVHEATGDEVLESGHVYLAPGSVAHLAIRKSGGVYRTVLIESEPVNRHRPSVDVLFSSVAKEAGKKATGIILTGMGKDGAQGLLEMRQAGADTFVQNEATCVVYGMPGEAMHIGATDEAVALDQIGERLFKGIAKAQSPLKR